MPRKRLVIVRIGFLIGLAMTVAWSLEPLFGPWVAVEATVYGRDRDVHISIEEDEPNEYFAVLDLCYEHDGGVFLDRHFLSHDGPTGWKLQDLSQAVGEAKRHPLGESRQILVHSSQPGRWVESRPLIWPWIVVATGYGAFVLLVAWELPALQAGALGLCLLVGLVSRNGGSAQMVSPDLDPRSLVAECSAPRAFERLPLGGPRTPETLTQALDEWGRPDLVWREIEESSETAYLLYRDGESWEQTWTLVFQRTEEGLVPLGPPQVGQRDNN